MKSRFNKINQGWNRGIDRSVFGRLQNGECTSDMKKSYAQVVHNDVNDWKNTRPRVN